ncbi:hypothetical protein KQI18_12505 [Clostridioides mangenotii]|nr:hypothetical protein [Clostridioides mangenotii]MBS5788348.1 hypothetical protein [Clostridioides difficile]MBU5308598.1 hypothetical protein [Clostridioides mangenotii]
MKIRFNMKGLVYGIIILVLVLGGFLVIPSMFVEKTKPIDYTVLQREAVPEKILDMMDKYTNEERALVAKMGNKIYIMVTRGEKKYGIEMDSIEKFDEDGKEVIRVKARYKDKEDSMPYLIVETNLENLPDRVELEITK